MRHVLDADLIVECGGFGFRESDVDYLLDTGNFIGHQLHTAYIKEACGRCTVRAACLFEALENPEATAGTVRSGLTTQERASLRLTASPVASGVITRATNA